MWRRAHRSIQLRENGHTGRLVPGLHHLFERPARGVRTPAIVDAAERLLEPHAVLGALVDLDVGEEPEERAAPVDAAPRVRVIETTIARAGQSVRKPLGEAAPGVLLRQEAGAH